MAKPPGCDCNRECGCQCPEEPVVLHEWTGGISGLSLNFRDYDGWGDNDLDHIRRRGVQYVWEVIWVDGGASYTGVKHPGVAQRYGLVHDGRHRSYFPNDVETSGNEGLPYYPANVVGTCPDLTLEMIDFTSIYGNISDAVFQLRIKCICCDSGRTFANNLVPPNGAVGTAVGLWDGMHRDELEFCRPDKGLIDRNQKCSPKIAYLNNYLTPFSMPARLVTLCGDDIFFWESWIRQFATTPTDGEYVFGTNSWSGTLDRVEVLWLSPYPDADPVHGTLQPIIDWLSIGGKVLVIDGGYLNSQVLSDFGFVTTWTALPNSNTGAALPTGTHPLVDGVVGNLMNTGTFSSSYTPDSSATVLGVDSIGNPLVAIEPYLGSHVITTSMIKTGSAGVHSTISELGNATFIQNIYNKKHLF